MNIVTKKCDISNRKHSKNIERYDEMSVIFDHDQEDGKSFVKPYFQKVDLDICSFCMAYMLRRRRYIYGYGAMGYNTYTL